MIDQRIIELEYYINHIDDFTLDDIAEKMLISRKQLGRLLKTWDEAGIIAYTPGRGRGNKVKIEMKRDVQTETVEEVYRNINNMSVKELQKLLQLPWRHHSFLNLQAIVNKKISEVEKPDSYELIEWVRKIPELIHPAHINDYLGAQLSHQMFDTLYRVSSTGEIIRNLVSYDNWVDNALHIHLKKQVKFSDGTLLTTRDVKRSLEYCASEQSPFASLFTVIEQIEIINEYYLILNFSRRPKFFEYTLTQKYSAIYKQVDEKRLIGTGPYQLEDHQEDSLTIRYNLFYRGHLPDIEKIKYLNKLSEHNQFDSYKKENNDVLFITIGEEFLLFNPHKDLTTKQRAFLSAVFMEVAEEYVESDQSNARNREYPLTQPLEEEHKITRPVKVVGNRYTQTFYEALKHRLLSYDVQLLIIDIEPIDYINKNLMTLDVDFIWMYENYHNLQPYKTLDLLKQCKFQEWYGHLTEGYKIVNDLEYKAHETQSNVGYQYFKKLNQKYLFVPVRKVKRKIYVAAHTKNVDALPYGIVNYIDVVLDKKTTIN
ncbi:ABC transporter substrate-binding protein [Macrococcus capreoli]